MIDNIETRGEFCFRNTIALLKKNGGQVPVIELIKALENMGWEHSMKTTAQKRKFLYEVLRCNRRDGRTKAGIIGDVVLLNFVKPDLPNLTLNESKLLLEILSRWQPTHEDGKRSFRVTFTATKFNHDDFTPKSEVYINGAHAGTVTIIPK